MPPVPVTYVLNSHRPSSAHTQTRTNAHAHTTPPASVCGGLTWVSAWPAATVPSSELTTHQLVADCVLASRLEARTQ